MLKTVTLVMCRFMPDIGFFFGKTSEGESIVGEAIVEPTGTVNVEGEYKTHQKYGRQFVVSHIYYRDLKSLVAVLLSSGFLLGIRERKAVDMANKLGERCFEVLDACLLHPEQKIAWEGMQRLPGDIMLDVHGIGKVVYSQIMESWKERRGIAAASMLAIRVDLKPGQFRKAIGYFGTMFQDVVINNAYALTNVSGITWETADRIALLEWEGKKAVDRNSVERLAAGVREILRTKKQVGGNMAYPIVETLGEAVALLSPINVKVWDTISPHLEKLGLVYSENTRMIAFKESYSIEKETARMLVSLMKAPPVFPARFLLNPQDYSNVKLGEEHIAAIRMVLENNVSIVTGGPGVGKTTSVLNTLLNIFDKFGTSYTLCAPTGKAAIRMKEATGRQAGTLHKEFLLYKDVEAPLMTKYLIIDEMSMTDADVFYRVLKNLKAGQAIVLIGDGDQLPPVGPGEPLKQMLLFDIPKIKLEHIYRQGAGSGIIKAAHMINHGEVPATMDNFIVESGDEINVREMIEKHIDTIVHSGIRFDEIQVLTPVNKGILGRTLLNKYLQDKYNPRPEDWKGDYMKDDRVIHCKNNYRLDVMNGEVGTVLAVNQEKAAVVDMWSPVKNWKVQVEYAIHGAIDYDDDALPELQLAYAMTIHKTQGSEFKAVIIVFPYTSPFFYLRPLPYTGITRAKDLCVVLSVGKAFSQYVKGRTKTQRYSQLSTLIQEAYGH